MRLAVGRLALLAILIRVVPVAAQELTTKQVVANLDQKARAFTSLEAAVASMHVEYGVKDPETTGKIFIRIAAAGPRILYDVTAPAADKKTVLIDKGLATIYFRNTNQYGRRDANKDMTDLLLLGFGVTSDKYTKSYTPEFKGREAINGVQAVLLELSANSETAQFKKITLWIDPTTWTSLQTRVSESSRTYTDFKYSSVRLNRNVSDSDFKLDIPKDATKQ